MLINQTIENPYSVRPIRANQSLMSETISSFANPVPTNNRTILQPNAISRPLNNVHPNYLKQLYMT